MSIHIASHEPVSSEPVRDDTVSTPPREPGLWFRTALLPGGWAEGVRVQTSGGRISLVESGTVPLSGDERAAVGLPGLPNAHSHAFQRGMAGLTERRGAAGEADTFWSWRQLMYQFVGRLAPEDLEALAAQAFLEMLEAGFTRVCEFHYVHHDVNGSPYANVAEMGERIASAADTTGIALTLLPVFYAHGGFGGAPVSAQQARFVNDVDGYGRLFEASRRAVSGLSDAVVGLAPHSLRAVTPDELRKLLPLAPDSPIHIHVAEQLREVSECSAALGARPVQWLMNAMPVDARWCLVHATHVTDDEVTSLARSGAVVGLCPITEANLGDGIFPAASLQARGGAYAIGTDSNVLISVIDELRLLEYGQRLREGARNVLAGATGSSTGRVLYEEALRGGLQAGGIAGVSGFAVGASADIISLTEDVAVAGRAGDALLDTFIFASPRGTLDGVWRAGKKVVSGGVHMKRAAIEARFRATLQKLLAV
jgi:formiminoglutamate deiminase